MTAGTAAGSPPAGPVINTPVVGWELTRHRAAVGLARSAPGQQVPAWALASRSEAPLAAAEISILAQSSYATDWVLVPIDRADQAVTAWRSAGHLVQGEGDDQPESIEGAETDDIAATAAVAVGAGTDGKGTPQ